MELFDNANNKLSSQPLAYRMRPRTLDEYIGQDHIVGPGRLLRRSIQADQLSSVIFYGPPGTGKTTLARVIANTTKSHFSSLNAVLSGVKELREEIDAARERLRMYGRRTILFVDEVHRWNKSQQDALLPWVENGTFILIGATTENPFFEVNAALVSRSRIFQLKALTDDDLFRIARQAIEDKERGYGSLNISFEAGALEHLIDVASGDARSLLNALELAVETTVKDGNNVFISKAAAEESIQKKAVLYDKEGDYHFDVISAFIKSIRGSDPDAALYWLAKMVYAGEDPRFIFRRMMISACEDVGLADPNAIVVVQSDAAAFDRIGMPEGNYQLTHACLYLATAPKSNSALGFFDALKTVEQEEKNAEVPNHLRDNSRDSKGFNHGEGYMYPHAYRDHWVAQQYLPNELQGKVYYQPGEIGYEATIKELTLKRREIQLESVDINAFPENLTYSPDNKDRDMWIRRSSENRRMALNKIRSLIFDRNRIVRSDRILVLNSGHGLLVWEALRKTPEGFVAAQIRNIEDAQYIEHYSKELKDIEKPAIIENLNQLDDKIRFEHILGRNIIVNGYNLKEIAALMSDNANLTTCETVTDEASKLSDFVHTGPTQNLLLEAEKKIYSTDCKVKIINKFSSCFKEIETQDFRFTENRIATRQDIERWLKKSYFPNLCLSEADEEKLLKELQSTLVEKNLNWRTVCLIINAKK